MTASVPRSGTVQIAASILSADFAALGEAVRTAERGGADRVHVDVMDGHFVPPITMGPMVVEAVRRVTRLPVDVHLMVAHPERHLEAFARAGADSLTVHVEATPHPHRALAEIRALGAQAGVALNPGTPADACAELREVLDLIVVMSVNPGYAGQAFLPSVLPKIGRLRTLLAGRPVRVEIDGGISVRTAPAAVAAGADVLVAASAIFQAPEGIEAAIAGLRAAIAP
ncbi:MAG: ribulose-phosphate 3-epimerase [Armatimonadota bacterium]|nr:ribulose-phosphate 3-epimerase [Armatimonadota bacterium]MDR7519026.1 ribulose-phosphate 3-epimerase [Armatimonadota bacterium]MDR7549195.1 ribulose-phosphate 3-epimerase [Armatimonadota bacterium]